MSQAAHHPAIPYQWPPTFSQRQERVKEQQTWQGDDLSVKELNNTRVMFHNIRSLSLSGTSGLDVFIQDQHSLNIDLQGFSEHCLDTTKFRVIQRARDILRQTFFGQATIQLHSSSEPALNNYKPGGTGILALGKLVSTIESQSRGGDNLGRWSYLSFRRKHLPPVTMVSVYQVCPRPTNHVGNTAYHQQECLLHSQGQDIHPRRAFIRDLKSFLTHLQSKGHDLIVGGDFNESLHDKNSGVLQLASSLQLTDPYLSKFPHSEEFGTHESGRRRIDMILVSPGILSCIAKVGYAPFGPFGYSTHSDHRPILMDLDTNILLGSRQFNPPPSPRKLFSKDKVAVSTYILTLYEALDRHQVFSRVTDIENDMISTEEVEVIDTLLGSLEELAEDKCKRRRPEYFSSLIVQQRFIVSTLKRHLIALQKDQDRSDQLLQRMARFGLSFELPPTCRLTKQALSTARNNLMETSRKSFETRKAAQEQQIEDLRAAKKTSRRKIVAAIQRAEQARATYKTLRALRRTQAGSSTVDHIEVPLSWPPPHTAIANSSTLEDPGTCTAWKIVTDPQEMEQYLLLRNRLHFGQAQGSPFTVSPLREEFNWLASSPAAKEVLQGNYACPTSHPQVQQLLNQCTSVTSLDSISGKLSMDEFRGKIQSWRESTTTSPPGRHLGRYKALFVSIPEEPETSDSPYGLTLRDMQEQIAQLKLSLLNYCIRNTYVLSRWRTVVNVMILKEPGNYKIHRLRVLHIYEADYNAFCAIKWRKLLQYAESQKFINEGQYGGRPGCEAQSLTLLEELKYDLSYLTRRSLFHFDNDATSCYDRIVVPVASLINRKYGLDRQVVSLHAETLRKANFYLKTANGISTSSYAHSEESPIHGTGQGSGNSPGIWLFISSTLFDLHTSQSNGASFISPDGLSHLHLSMVGFVDDSTGTCNDFQPQSQESLSTLFSRMQHDAQLWNDLLYSTGGKLELSKCSFHLLHFQYLPSGRPIPVIDKYADKIHIIDAETAESIPITSKRSFEFHKTLGHYKAPAATNTSITFLQQKAKRLATLIAASPLSRYGARLAYTTIYVPSIKYTLPQSFYSKTVLDHAQAQSHAMMLSKTGYNRNISRAIAYAPLEFAGGGFLPWYLLQGEGQLLLFIKHLRTDTVISKALRLTVQWAQWQSGHSKSIMNDVDTPLPFLECRWLRSVRTFLAYIRGRVLLLEPHVPSPERANDVYIMEVAQTCGEFSNEDLTIINYCRLYLHVTTVSELFDADGISMNEDLFYCRREPWFNKTTYVALQQRPSEYYIQSRWQCLCRKWITPSGKATSSLKLGRWLRSGEKLRRRRKAYVTRDGRYFQWRQGQYWEYQRSNPTSPFYTPVGPTDWLPDQCCIPIPSCRRSKVVFKIFRAFSRSSIHSPSEIPPTFSTYIRSLSPWEEHLILGVKMFYQPYEIIHYCQRLQPKEALYLVSDGSCQVRSITYGWVLGTSSGVILAEHAGYGYGTLTSHRAEAWGALSAITFQTYTKLQIPLTTSPIQGFMDNSGLVLRLNTRRDYATVYPNATLAPDWDLVEMIHQTTTKLHPTEVTYAWVRGHQNEQSSDITTEALYNIRADELAGKVKLPKLIRISLSPFVLPTEQCQLVLDHKSIHGKYVHSIRHAYTVPPLLSYLRNRNNWDTMTAHLVDWQIFTQAARTTTISSTQLTKLVYNKLPTQYEQSKSNPHISPQCNYCTNLETFDHLLLCHSPVSTKFRRNIKETIILYLHKKDLPPSFSQLVESSFSQWLPTSDVTPKHTTTASTVFQSQHEIGWHLFYRGFLTTEWRSHLDQYYRKYTCAEAKDSTNVLVGLIHIIWDELLRFWSSHLSAINNTSPDSSCRKKDHIQEYKTRIQLLYSKKDQCLHSHRAAYFPQDVQKFLDSSTMSQLKTYLHSYEPAIRKSIKAASNISLRPLHSFPGFTRKPSQHRDHTNRVPPMIPARPGTFPHKHSRWKSLSSIPTSIKQFFFPPSSQPPAPT